MRENLLWFFASIGGAVSCVLFVMVFVTVYDWLYDKWRAIKDAFNVRHAVRAEREKIARFLTKKGANDLALSVRAEMHHNED